MSIPVLLSYKIPLSTLILVVSVQIHNKKIIEKKKIKSTRPLVQDTAMLALLYIYLPLHIPEIKATSSAGKNTTAKVTR